MNGANRAGPPMTPVGGSFTPQAALDRGVGGYVVLHCVVGDDQSLSRCEVLHEDPTGWGFADAALRTRGGMKIRERLDGEVFTPTPGKNIFLPVIFCPSEQPGCHAQMKAAFVRFESAMRSVFSMVEVGDCLGAAKGADDLKSPQVVQIVEDYCRAKAPKGGPVG